MPKYKSRKWMSSLHKQSSDWEKRLADTLFKECVHQPKNYVHFVVEHDYTPDELIDLPDGRRILIECKGFFKTSEEASKYRWIREALQPNEELIFVFYNAKNPMPNSRKRKNGTRFCCWEWAERHDFRWFTEETFSWDKV